VKHRVDYRDKMIIGLYLKERFVIFKPEPLDGRPKMTTEEQ